MVQAWTPDFDSLRHDITTTPVWVRLTNIPVTFYHKAILMGIAKGLGKPVKVDLTTMNFERARFARVCVEVNLAKPLKGTILINGDRYFVAYEGLNVICSGCGLYGHLVHNCPKAAAPMVTAPVRTTGVASASMSQNMVEERRETSQAEMEFQTVRGSRRKSAGSTVSPAAEPVAFTAWSSGGVEARKSRNILANIPKTNIPNSNRFDSLAVDTELTESREDGVLVEVDKENVNDGNIHGIEKSTGHGNQLSLGGKMNKRTDTNKLGPRGKRAGKASSSLAQKKNVPNGQNRPMRGLVFGPTTGEVERSDSGKRLRTESGNIGRVGGTFPIAEDEAYVEQGTPLDLMCVQSDLPSNPIHGEPSEGEMREATSPQEATALTKC
ncbi:unnamed protein product [Microthlaspi erraticum]|uniref:MH2 domain-containing protein n=1 Tax=Microthlaspi erraticum TaxID=1685480 RepID=A0A6D2IVJ7_9BRAS|nr:unnamed protein product [Microthlaspi erraticum]